MRISKLLLIAILVSSIAPLSAESIYLSKLESWLEIIEDAPAESDNIVLNVSLLNKDRTLRVKFPAMVGPVYFSEANSQIFSCEANSTQATENASAWDLKGNNVFDFKHVGFVRACGITNDKKIYWLHYNAYENNKHINVFFALSKTGQVLFKEKFHLSKNVAFTYEGNQYTVNVPDSEYPG